MARKRKSMRMPAAWVLALLVAAPLVGVAAASAAPGDACGGGLFGRPDGGTGFTPSGGFTPDTPCPGDTRATNDSAFLGRLAQAGITPNGGTGTLGLLGSAKSICYDIQHGNTLAAVEANIQSQAPSMSHDQIVTIVDAAQAVYCPSADGAAPW